MEAWILVLTRSKRSGAKKSSIYINFPNFLPLLISNLIAFYTKSGEYGANGNELFITGRGSIFCFVILAVYGIPIGLILKYFNLLNNISAIGYSIVGYYAILLFFEIKFIIKSINS